AVAQHVHGQYGQRQEYAGQEDVVRILVELGAAFGHDVAPGRHVGGQADAQKGKYGLDQYRRRAHISALHDEGGDGVGQDMLEKNLPDGRIERDGRLDIGFFAYGQHHRAHQPGHAGNLGDGDGDDDGRYRAAEQRHQADGEQDARNGHEAVHQAHDQPVYSAEVSGQQAHQHAQGQGQQCHGHAYGDGNAGAVKGAAPDVAAQGVGAHQKEMVKGVAGQAAELAGA